MKNRNMFRKALSLLGAASLLFSLAACGGETVQSDRDLSAYDTVYTIGICNYVDDASLNQIVANIETRLNELSDQSGSAVAFKIDYENCNGDAAVMEQIVQNFIASDVDLMVGVATPVAMKMQAATEDTDLPVVFSAVSDPLSAQLVDSLEAPGANITGTSDYLNTDAILDLIFALDPNADTIGLLYNPGQDSSTTPIANAKDYLTRRGVKIVERTGTTTDEVKLAAQALVSDGVDAVFTPTDNTIMTAQLSIYEIFADAGIPHFTGADSFALNGAFLGYGVDYAELGQETANLVYEILVNGANPAETPVVTFDNGTATLNTDICAALGYDPLSIQTLFAPYSTSVQTITTAEDFSDLP